MDKYLLILKLSEVGQKVKVLVNIEGKVVFVERAVPGDIADIYITDNRKGYMEGDVHTL